MNKVRGKELARAVSDALNTFAFEEQIEEFVKEMGNEHRTLQQTFTRLCVGWLTHLSETERYDLRNEDSVMFAREIKDKLKEAHFRFV